MNRGQWLASYIGNNKAVGVELGVLRGPTFKALIKICPNLTLTGIDVFTPDRYWQANKITTTEELLKIQPLSWFDELLEFCREYPYRAHIRRDFTNKAHANFEDGSLDFVFIDADHSMEAVDEDIRLWEPKVKKGGLVSGHDIDMLSVKMAVMNHNPQYEEGPDNVWYWKKE